LYVFLICKRRKEKEKDVMPTTKPGSIHMAIIFNRSAFRMDLRKRTLYKKEAQPL